MQFELKAQFQATPQAIYDAWLSDEGHSKMTSSIATASNEVGGEYTAHDGYIIGKNLELEPNKRIVQSWRASEFEEQHDDSRLEVVLKEMENGTELTLTHSHLPDSIGERYKQGWVVYYFEPMKAYFS